MKGKPTEKELEILQVLWQKEKATVRQVHEYLHEGNSTAYTTTLKHMQIMFEKGLLLREKSGKSHIYAPAQAPDTTRSGLVQNLIDQAFGGSARSLVMQALGSEKTSPEDLAEIQQFLNAMREEGAK